MAASDESVNEAVQRCVKLFAREIALDIKLKIEARARRRRRCWVRSCYAKPDELGAASTVLQEWANDSPDLFRNHLRISVSQSENILEKVCRWELDRFI